MTYEHLRFSPLLFHRLKALLDETLRKHRVIIAVTIVAAMSSNK